MSSLSGSQIMCRGSCASAVPQLNIQGRWTCSTWCTSRSCAVRLKTSQAAELKHPQNLHG